MHDSHHVCDSVQHTPAAHETASLNRLTRTRPHQGRSSHADGFGFQCAAAGIDRCEARACADAARLAGDCCRSQPAPGARHPCNARHRCHRCVTGAKRLRTGASECVAGPGFSPQARSARCRGGGGPGVGRRVRRGCWSRCRGKRGRKHEDPAGHCGAGEDGCSDRKEGIPGGAKAQEVRRRTRRGLDGARGDQAAPGRPP